MSAGGIIWAGQKVCVASRAEDSNTTEDASDARDTADGAQIDVTDGTGTDPDIGDAEEVLACEASLQRCDGICVDTQSNNDHCGECSRSCGHGGAANSTCRDGDCETLIDYDNSQNTHADCTDAGGEIVAISGDSAGSEVCRFDAGECPDGWSNAADWTTAEAQSGGNWEQVEVPERTYSCNGLEAIWKGTSAASGTLMSGQHDWSNMDPAQHDESCMTWEPYRDDRQWCNADCFDSPGCNTNQYLETYWWQSCKLDDETYLTYEETCGSATEVHKRGDGGISCATGEEIELMAAWNTADGTGPYRRQLWSDIDSYSASAEVTQRGCK